MTMAPSAARASRAVGAIFFTLFGAAWLLLWYLRTGSGGPLGWLVIVVEAALLLGFAVRQHRRHRGSLMDEAARARKRRSDRVFAVVNILQWVLIFAGSEALTRYGLADWVVPAVLGIVGLHLLPLGAVFEYQPHYITGGLLITLAAIYPVLAAEGPTSPVGLFGAGVILWGSAAWALASPAR